MSTPALARQTVHIPLESIDPPELDARIDRDPELLEELARDILRRGLIEPIKVVRTGERFEIVDGFRRYLATRSANLPTIECFVYETKELALEGVKYATGVLQEKFSPADEAIYFNQLLTHECGNDIEKLAALVGRKISYIDGRLELLNGDELVFDALKAHAIKIGVAHELNKCDDPEYRRYFLKHAIEEGSSVTVVAGWVTQWRVALGDRNRSSSAPAEPTSGPTPTLDHDPFRCFVCLKTDPRFIPETLYAHSHCRLAILEPMLRGARGDE